MKEITIHEKEKETINFSDINELDPIFAKQRGKLCGMIAKEDEGWILRTGGDTGATGHHPTLFKCIKSCIPYGYAFFVN